MSSKIIVPYFIIDKIIFFYTGPPIFLFYYTTGAIKVKKNRLATTLCTLGDTPEKDASSYNVFKYIKGKPCR